MSESTPTASQGAAVSYPGVRLPDRTRRVDSNGLSLAVYEWGEESAPPLLLAHGGFDFARTFDLFAPLLADGGWRVVSWDQRGHGDSEHAALYSWQADVRDALAVLDATSREPVAAVGHSKGGGLLLGLVHALPERFTRYVAIEGLSAEPTGEGASLHAQNRFTEAMVSDWLDHRRRVAGSERRPDTLDGLARRRARMNPRLPHAWLRYLVSAGARHDADGWRWRIDPALRFGGVGPYRPAWTLRWMPEFPRPLLGILGLVIEGMSMGATPESLGPHLPDGARLETFEDAGHFIHIERPRCVADLVLGFLS